jgi:hypothetical protein
MPTVNKIATKGAQIAATVLGYAPVVFQAVHDASAPTATITDKVNEGEAILQAILALWDASVSGGAANTAAQYAPVISKVAIDFGNDFLSAISPKTTSS